MKLFVDLYLYMENYLNMKLNITFSSQKCKNKWSVLKLGLNWLVSALVQLLCVNYYVNCHVKNYKTKEFFALSLREKVVSEELTDGGNEIWWRNCSTGYRIVVLDVF